MTRRQPASPRPRPWTVVPGLALLVLALLAPLLAGLPGPIPVLLAQDGAAAEGEAEAGDREVAEPPSDPGASDGEVSDREERGREVIVVSLAGPVQPIMAERLADAREEAQIAGAAALVVELDTPGGLVTSMRDMVRTILGSSVPVVIWVGPEGAQAASAGFFLLQAADLAAMAPGTNTGAATPVAGSGEDIEGAMGDKVEQDAAALVRSLAQRNGRPADLAESAVTEATSWSAEEALEVGLIEAIAPTLSELLATVDGRVLASDDEGTGERLATAGTTVRQIEPNPRQQFLSVLANPAVLSVLFTLGLLGITVEIYNPGAIFPGVIGALCLVLGFFGSAVLPINVVGLMLLGLAVLFFVAEIKIASYGLLSAGGVVSLVVGLVMLIDSPDPAVRVSLGTALGVGGVAGILVVAMVALVVRSHRNRVTTGVEGMVGERGTARSPLDPEGKVWVHGELWDAVSDKPVETGARVEVVRVEGMWLRVRPVAKTGATTRSTVPPAAPPSPGA